MGLIVFGVLLTVAVFWAIGAYNRLVELRNRFKNAFAQIDVQLKRRYDLIPNLVETAKGYMKHERETLEAVIQARNGAVTANQRAILPTRLPSRAWPLRRVRSTAPWASCSRWPRPIRT
jgi:LemA protein